MLYYKTGNETPEWKRTRAEHKISRTIKSNIIATNRLREHTIKVDGNTASLFPGVVWLLYQIAAKCL